jgi:serine/threonine protein kinase/dipeptidyl aminopeptidase/acylaminoacyl peptidase
MPVTVGSRLGPYEILAPLGAGGMGEVYRAHDTKLGRDIAIKVLPAATAADPAALARFEREARAVAQLSHPNILAIHDFGEAEGVVYAAMELLSGETLRHRIDHRSLSQRRAVEIGREIALALAAAHEMGIVHRDLKPENVFLTRDGLVKVLDFGLAKQMHRDRAYDGPTLTSHSQAGAVVGTAGYMSPEQVRGDPVDPRADIFSLGAVLYEMLSGRREFKGDTSVETMNAILREDPAPLSQGGKPLSPALERIVARCLEKSPAQRFQSASDLAFDLGALSTATSTPEAGRPRPGRSIARRALLFAGLAAAVGLAFWIGSRRSGSGGDSEPPRFRRLTFRRGAIQSARFAPDGRTVVYGAAWDGKPYELFSVRTDTVESLPLGIANAEILSISSRGDMAINLQRRGPFGPGTLARVPLGGGVPREIAEPVWAASWAPNGEDLAIERDSPDAFSKVEYPIGHTLLRSYFLQALAAVSPDGNWVAVAERQHTSRLTVWVIDRKGAKRALVRNLERRPDGFAWSPDSRELYFVGGQSSESQALRAVSLAGRERVVLPAVGASLRLHDIAPDGRLLVERRSSRRGLICMQTQEKTQQDVSWLDGTSIAAVSDDGSTVLFSETGDGGRSTEGDVYTRRCDGSPPVRLGPGAPMHFSPDGRWVLSITKANPSELLLLPTGVGTPRKIPVPFQPAFASFDRDGKRINTAYPDEKGEARFTSVEIDDGKLQELPPHPDDASLGEAQAPDGASYYVQTSSQPAVIPSPGRPPRPLPGPPLRPHEAIRGLSADGRYLYIAWMMGVPAQVSRREIATGKTTPWFAAQPADVVGVTAIGDVHITPDGRTCVFSYERVEASDLFVVDGLR